MCTFDDPTHVSKGATVHVTAPRDAGWGCCAREARVGIFVIGTTVGVDTARTAQRPSEPAADRHTMTSISAANCVTSLRLGPVRTAAIGVPLASVAMWCLEPGSARSVGSGPFFARPNRAHQGRIHGHAREIDLVYCSQSRQQLTPEPHPISAGRSRHRMPVFSTNRVAVSAVRSGTGLHCKRSDCLALDVDI